ncbi:hypothetical protein [Bradyrhizobium sp. JR3.5]
MVAAKLRIEGRRSSAASARLAILARIAFITPVVRVAFGALNGCRKCMSTFTHTVWRYCIDP